MPLDKAIQQSGRSWTGSLDEAHLRAIQLLETERDALREAMSALLTPEQLAEYLEISHNQFLELVRPNTAKEPPVERPEG